MDSYVIDSNDLKIYPIGLTRLKGGIHVSVEAEAKECCLLLYPRQKRPGEEEPVRIPFPARQRMGNVWEMTMQGRDFDRYLYAYEADGRAFSDPCGQSFSGHEEWGRAEGAGVLLKSPIRRKSFDWEDDEPLHIPYEDCIVYRSHVRGFTRHPSSGVTGRGTFRGIAEKIPYLKELGITTLSLLPIAEFNEIMMSECRDRNPYKKPEPTGKLNYWGYCSAYAFAPKASYAGKRNDPVIELKKLVKALHAAGIELVLEMFFTGREAPSYVLQAVRHWVREYHIDGVHFIGYAPIKLLAKDPYLTGTKLWAARWDAEDVEGGHRFLAEYNEDFQTDMRRCLKGDADRMRRFAECIRRRPSGRGQLNFLAGTNGFTLMDMVCYEHKHNEANGENNLDGNDYNDTWNCGEEGPSRRRKILELRGRQLRNALILLFLSQGTPVIMAGDEFGNSQNGNNNAYCQDNGVSWLNWRQQKTHRDLLLYTKKLIAFRKAHPVFHQAAELKGLDYLACGHPDISYHGSRAWVPDFEVSSRQLGVFYSGAYGRKKDSSEDNYFYVAYNMHWEPHDFALPNLPRPNSWHMAIDTGNEDGCFFAEGKEPELQDQRQLKVPPRTVQVLIGKPGTLNPEKKREKKAPKKRSEKTQKSLTNTGKEDINGKV